MLLLHRGWFVVDYKREQVPQQWSSFARMSTTHLGLVVKGIRIHIVHLQFLKNHPWREFSVGQTIYLSLSGWRSWNFRSLEEDWFRRGRNSGNFRRESFCRKVFFDLIPVRKEIRLRAFQSLTRFEAIFFKLKFQHPVLATPSSLLGGGNHAEAPEYRPRFHIIQT